MEEFEPSSRLGIGIGGVRAKFEGWYRKSRSLSKVPKLGIGNGRVRAKFEAWNQEWRSSSQVRGLESEMEVFELSSDAVSWPHPSDIAVDPRLPLLLMGMGPAHCGTCVNTLSIPSKFQPH